MTERPESQVSESQIAVHWREEEYYYPPEAFIAQANAADPAIYDRFREDRFPDCFKEYADLLTWDARGTRRWTPATRRSGSGLSAVG
jgi:acetyl-CoA synthetase